MKLGINLQTVLKNLLIPIISSILCLILYVVFVSPYNNYVLSFDEMKNNYENSISNLSSNLNVLEKASKDKERLLKLDSSLKSLIPDNANASDLVGLIGKTGEDFRFRSVDENRNVTNTENSKSRIIEVRFNGRAPGMASSINFLKSLTGNQSKLIKITRLELTNFPQELFTRISFNALSLYTSPITPISQEVLIQNLFDDAKFMDLVDKFSK